MTHYSIKDELITRTRSFSSKRMELALDTVARNDRYCVRFSSEENLNQQFKQETDRLIKELPSLKKRIFIRKGTNVVRDWNKLYAIKQVLREAGIKFRTETNNATWGVLPGHTAYSYSPLSFQYNDFDENLATARLYLMLLFHTVVKLKEVY